MVFVGLTGFYPLTENFLILNSDLPCNGSVTFTVNVSSYYNSLLFSVFSLNVYPPFVVRNFYMSFHLTFID